MLGSIVEDDDGEEEETDEGLRTHAVLRGKAEEMQSAVEIAEGKSENDQTEAEGKPVDDVGKNALSGPDEEQDDGEQEKCEGTLLRHSAGMAGLGVGDEQSVDADLLSGGVLVKNRKADRYYGESQDATDPMSTGGESWIGVREAEGGEQIAEGDVGLHRLPSLMKMIAHGWNEPCREIGACKQTDDDHAEVADQHNGA